MPIPASPKLGDQKWQDLVTVKNTFIDCTSPWTEAASVPERRANSDPSDSSSSQSYNAWSDTEESGSGSCHAPPATQARSSCSSEVPGTEPAIPLDPDGLLTSVGSLNHPSSCKPCTFFQRGECNRGTACVFCHFHHAGGKKAQPCKARRDKYRNLVARLFAEIDANPEGFDVDSIELPMSICSLDYVKEKFRLRLRVHKAECLARRANVALETEPLNAFVELGIDGHPAQRVFFNLRSPLVSL